MVVQIMSSFLVAVTGAIYLWIAFEQTAFKGDWAMGIVYFGYALANVGLYVAVSKGVNYT
jgi:hypothetical protein